MSKKGDQEIHLDETVSLPISIESNGFVYEDRFKKIEKITATFADFNKEYFVADFGLKAAVLVVQDGQILLARQYRLFINGLSYEIPGGRVNEGESPEEAALRECLEETGVICHNLTPLISYDPDLEYTKNHTYVFYADEADNADKKPASNHVWVPIEKCLQMIYKGEISDSLSIIAILAYKGRPDPA
jgi:ADP-ribose pyrophosphatase YjhB (NUDIX family)